MMSLSQSSFYYGTDHLTCRTALMIADGRLKGEVSPDVIEKIRKSRIIVEQIALDDQAVYGINTGFGPLCTTKISSRDTELLQHNILTSHSVGVGQSIDPILVKLMLILKAHSLAQGFSGISFNTFQRILWHIDHDALPVVPSQGSVGASGDLAPLAHLFLPLIGLGEVSFQGEVMATKEMFQRTGLSSVQLHAKEGLALINGTQFIAAHAVLGISRLHHCLNQADIIAALMIDGLLGSISPFKKELHKLRPFPGSVHVAHRIYSILKDSEIVLSHEGCNRVQDPYSLRCIPQVHGASRSAWLHLKKRLKSN